MRHSFSVYVSEHARVLDDVRVSYGTHELILLFKTPDGQSQCCQHLLTRNPKIYEENPGEYIGLMGIDS